MCPRRPVGLKGGSGALDRAIERSSRSELPFRRRAQWTDITAVYTVFLRSRRGAFVPFVKHSEVETRRLATHGPYQGEERRHE